MSKTESGDTEAGTGKGYRGGKMEMSEKKAFRYYKNAVERHWNPWEIDLEQDRENMLDTYGQIEDDEVREQITTVIRKLLAMFGAGEASVTEDIAPLAIAFDDVEDEMFISSHMYEEAKHLSFFDRYWDEVINPLEREAGMEVSSPNDDRWFCDGYEKLFDAEEEAMHTLLTDDTPENRVRAYCTYQLTAEGIIAQTGYWGITRNFKDGAGTEVELSGERFEIPELPGLVEGINGIRSDEGRHIGFGMYKVKQHIMEGDVDADFVENRVEELLPYTIEIVNYAYEGLDDTTVFPVGPGDAAEYTRRKHMDRMGQITEDEGDIPELEELTTVE
ncbi:MAG: ribonucleoside-diphosphate reductase [Halobacteria archaeon]|nr:ribonucleoside-diphosphate reductase [Halobacteria archaeon]